MILYISDPSMTLSISQRLSLWAFVSSVCLLAASGCGRGPDELAIDSPGNTYSNQAAPIEIAFTGIGTGNDSCYATVNANNMNAQVVNGNRVRFINIIEPESERVAIEVYFLPIKLNGNGQSSQSRFDFRLSTRGAAQSEVVRMIGIPDSSYLYVGYLPDKAGCSNEPPLLPANGGGGHPLLPDDPPRVIIRD